MAAKLGSFFHLALIAEIAENAEENVSGILRSEQAQNLCGLGAPGSEMPNWVCFPSPKIGTCLHIYMLVKCLDTPMYSPNWLRSFNRPLAAKHAPFGKLTAGSDRSRMGH